MNRTVVLCALATLLLLAPTDGRAQAGSTTTASTTSQTVRPVLPTRPQAAPQAQAPTTQAEVEKQVRDMILRQGRMSMNALVPGSGLGLTQDRFEDGLDTPSPAIAPPVRTGPVASAKTPLSSGPRKPYVSHLPKYRLGERVSEPLPMRRAGNYAW